jgi:hypothetical protein
LASTKRQVIEGFISQVVGAVSALWRSGSHVRHLSGFHLDHAVLAFVWPSARVPILRLPKRIRMIRQVIVAAEIIGIWDIRAV